MTEAARAWAIANGVERQRTEHRLSPTMTRTSYGKGGEAEVTLWTLADAGHTWPGHPGGPMLRLLVGKTSREVDATEELWRFFRRHIQPRKCRVVTELTSRPD